MYCHYILLFSDYEQGVRKAYYKTLKDFSKIDKFKKEIKEIRDEFKNIDLCSHFIMTESEEISSVPAYDEYFEGVSFYSNKEDFKKELMANTKITPSDILKYILIKKECTKLKAMKLIYLVYERYLQKTGNFLFEEDFLAWQYGPVIKSAYQQLSAYKYEKIKLKNLELEKVKLNLKLSRIENKSDIIECIDSVLSDFGNWSCTDLINLTHKKEKPWYKVCNQFGLNNAITKDIMLECVNQI